MFSVHKCQHSKSPSNFSNSFSFEHSETNKCEKRKGTREKREKSARGPVGVELGRREKRQYGR